MSPKSNILSKKKGKIEKMPKKYEDFLVPKDSRDTTPTRTDKEQEELAKQSELEFQKFYSDIQSRDVRKPCKFFYHFSMCKIQILTKFKSYFWRQNLIKIETSREKASKIRVTKKMRSIFSIDEYRHAAVKVQNQDTPLTRIRLKIRNFFKSTVLRRIQTIKG